MLRDRRCSTPRDSLRRRCGGCRASGSSCVLAGGLGLVAYAAADRAPGPAYLGVANLGRLRRRWPRARRPTRSSGGRCSCWSSAALTARRRGCARASRCRRPASSRDQPLAAARTTATYQSCPPRLTGARRASAGVPPLPAAGAGGLRGRPRGRPPAHPRRRAAGQRQDGHGARDGAAARRARRWCCARRRRSRPSGRRSSRCSAGRLRCALTYQALCQTDDPGRRAARGGRGAARAGGADSRRRDDELARAVAALKSEIARGGDARALLSANAVARRGRAARRRRAHGDPRRVPPRRLDVGLPGARGARPSSATDVHVIGLTATAPDDMTADEAALYEELLGPVDFHTPTPAVVREGFLAPFQELALFTTPLDSELEWLRRAPRALPGAARPPDGHDGDELSFPVWVSNRHALPRARATRRSRSASCCAASRRWPAPACATSRPPGCRCRRARRAARASASRRRWRTGSRCSSDYALRCLRAHAGTGGEARTDALAVGLADLGFTLTRTGIRPGRTDIDRVLVNSSAKPILACEALAVEHEARGDALRAVVLCDSERPPQPAGGLGAGARRRRARAAATRSPPTCGSRRCGRCWSRRRPARGDRRARIRRRCAAARRSA